MKVILIASGDLWAGAEVMVCQLAIGYSKNPDLNLLVVLLNKNKLADKLERHGVEVRVVEESQNSFISIVRSVRKLVNAFSPDIIHSHRYKENLLAWITAFGRKNIKLVATQHGMPEISGGSVCLTGRFRAAIFFRLLSHCFDNTVLVSEEMRKSLINSYGFSSKTITVIHNGISLPKDICSGEGRRLVIGSAGRLYPVKNFSMLVDIGHSVVMQNDIVDFVIAGAGPQYAMLEEKIQSYGLQDRFKILGHIDDMRFFYKNLDVYVNTSIHEGIPMSVLEAMSYGLPVVAANVGGLPEIIKNGVNGFLIEGYNKNIYINHLLELINNQDLRLVMAKYARDRVSKYFSLKVMADNYYQLYRRLMRREQ